MNRFFGDSFYYLALVNRKDNAHERAVAFSNQTGIHVVTTEWVLIEVADALAAPANRAGFLNIYQTLLHDVKHQILSAFEAQLARGVELYSSREDKGWSLTDCILFYVMKRHSLTEALTGDHHFEQAGFVALLK